jgi:hypothetical protein
MITNRCWFARFAALVPPNTQVAHVQMTGYSSLLLLVLAGILISMRSDAIWSEVTIGCMCVQVSHIVSH